MLRTSRHVGVALRRRTAVQEVPVRAQLTRYPGLEFHSFQQITQWG